LPPFLQKRHAVIAPDAARVRALSLVWFTSCRGCVAWLISCHGSPARFTLHRSLVRSTSSADECPNNPNLVAVTACGNCNDASTGLLDDDGDGILNCFDNCVNDVNPGQADRDSDGYGDVCDTCPDNPLLHDLNACGTCDDTLLLDSDGDGVPDCVDGCPHDL
jgi:hypothetical protein